MIKTCCRIAISEIGGGEGAGGNAGMKTGVFNDHWSRQPDKFAELVKSDLKYS